MSDDESLTLPRDTPWPPPSPRAERDFAPTKHVARQFGTFVILGLIGTGLFFVIYNVLRPVLDPFWSNVGAVILSMGFSFVANRRWTFHHRGRERRLRHLVGFLIVFTATLALTSLAVTRVVPAGASRIDENMALAVAHGSVVVLRFTLLRRLVFPPR